MKKKNKKKIWLIISSIVIVAIIAIGVCAKFYYHYTVSNFTSRDGKSHTYYIYPNTSVAQLLKKIEKDYQINSETAWRIHCHHLQFEKIKPGHYELPAKISNRALILRFQQGQETPIKLSFNQSLRKNEQVAAHMGNKLLLDSAEVASRMNDPVYMEKYGLNKATALCLFIPNTYEVYWGMSVDQLFERMHKEYERFWNSERLGKASKLGLNPVEVATLASIVASESNNTAEQPLIASLYINRIKKGMLLQADPTVVYANDDFTIRRVLKKHLEKDSPYNTYKYKGLPPGPIRLTNTTVLDAVLNAPSSDYLYMCANPDFSGTHVFTSTYSKHLEVARQYQRELNKRKIK